MAYENIKINHTNFCIGPTNGHYCSIDYDNDLFRFYNSTGDIIGSAHNLSSSVSEIKSLEYPGPRYLNIDQDRLGDYLPFFTLERSSSTQCVIKEWKINETTTTLDLDNTITKTNADNYYFDCYDMSVEYYHTVFDGATTTGTGKIKLDTYNNVEAGDRLLLGPSTDVTDLYETEWVEVTSVSGGWVYIDSLISPSIIPPLNEYDDQDDITYTKAIYLFSNIGYGNDTTKGCLYKLHPYTGNVIEYHNSAIYHSNEQPSSFSASAWSLDYSAVGFVRGSNLLYVDPNNDYQITKSQALTNIDSDEATILPVFDLIFDNNAIYRLQNKITLLDDNGDKVTNTWTTYNYHRDSIIPYTLTLDISADPVVLYNLNTVTLTSMVRDNFGVGLSSKTIQFYKSGDASGYFTPLDGQSVTNADGIAQILYTTDGNYNPYGSDPDFNFVSITAKTDGGSTDIGIDSYTGLIWGGINLLANRKFTGNIIDGDIIQKPTLISSDPYDPSTVNDELKIATLLRQWEDIEDYLRLDQYSKFQFPGGHWVGSHAPSDSTTLINQLDLFSSVVKADQIDSEFDNNIPIDQLKEKSDITPVSQTYVSKHLSTGHTDDVVINQFRFIEDAIPPFWSEKNSIDTNIWIRLRPFGFDLNQSTLVFKVREVSYAGDTDYIDVTSSCIISTFDAGGGLLGLDILYDPPSSFHHNGIVYVYIEVYDGAPTPNIILTEYWFKIIPDYHAPYITNESPSREATDVDLNSSISFDILDAGVGVDINTLEFYINNRWKVPVVSVIPGGYHVFYNLTTVPYYGETAEITVKIQDASDFQNTLYDMWRFYYEGSTGPWIDRDSFYPGSCREGVSRKQNGISINIYGIDDTGVNRDSIVVYIGGKERNVVVRPIIYRIS